MTAKQIDGIVVERVDGELFAYNAATEEAHALNEAATVVFELCDGKTTVDAMSRELAQRLSLPDDPAIVLLALDELRDAGLIEVRDDEDAHGFVPEPLSRRQLMRRIGVGAALVAALPVVESIVVPTAAAAESAPPSPSPTPTPTPPPPS